ncbi:MAG: ribbon-helix-helix protein, CopG family [Pseudomonadota bacterium]
MHFNIYIDDQTGQQLTDAAHACGQPRNALIREAVQQWLDRRKSQLTEDQTLPEPAQYISKRGLAR